jgi:chaperonin GroES
VLDICIFANKTGPICAQPASTPGARVLNQTHFVIKPRSRAKNPEAETERSFMATNIKPLHDRVILKRIEEGEQVRGGIIIPDSAKEKPQEGEVIAVGDGKRKDDGTRIPLDVQAGDRVLFGKYSGSEIKVEGEEYLIMREDEILGVISRAGAASGKKGGK